jgi:hypothetical protein
MRIMVSMDRDVGVDEGRREAVDELMMKKAFQLPSSTEESTESRDVGD